MVVFAVIPLLLLLALVGFWALAAMGMDWRVRYREWTAGTCGVCGYDLEGLAAGARCPECGREEPGLRRSRRREWFLNPLCLASFFLMLAPVLVVAPMAQWIWYGLYRLEGWPASISARMVGDGAEQEVFGAYFVGVALAHPFALLLGTRRRVTVGALGAALGVAGVCAALAVHWRGGSVRPSGCGELVLVFTAGAVMTAGVVGRLVWPPAEEAEERGAWRRRESTTLGA